LRKHLKEDHQKVIEYEELSFASFSEFETWKQDMEQRTNSRFIKITGSRNLAKLESKVIAYECQRSKFSQHKSKCDDEFSISKKMESRCPAQIRYFDKPSGPIVHFYQSHSHELFSRHCSLSRKSQESVADMLRSGYSNEYILKLFDQLPVGNRDRYITSEDIRLIGIRKGLINDGRNHKDDAKSVHIFVEKNKDSVILYRPNTTE
jgi:hypothetical protein